MDNKKVVSHIGIVKSVERKGIKVGIVVTAGCASCDIKGSCNMSEQTEKELDIDCDASAYKVGQKVLVKLREKQGFEALFLGYGLPFFILLAVMIVATNLSDNEGLVGLLALGSLIPYYILLYFFRNKIKKKFTYVVDPLKA